MLYLCRPEGKLSVNYFFLLFHSNGRCSVEEPITPAKRKRIPSSKAAAGTSDYPSKCVDLCMVGSIYQRLFVFRVSKGRALVSSDEETSRKKPKSANRIAPVADEFSDPESVNVSVVYVKLCFAYYCNVDCATGIAKKSINWRSRRVSLPMPAPLRLSW